MLKTFVNISKNGKIKGMLNGNITPSYQIDIPRYWIDAKFDCYLHENQSLSSVIHCVKSAELYKQNFYYKINFYFFNIIGN